MASRYMQSQNHRRTPNTRPITASCVVESLESRQLLSVLYVDAVDHNGATSNNGTSWYAAYTNLQQAITAAGGGDEIRVADGAYKPTTTADRTKSFQLKTGVTLRGGYAGYGAANPDSRDVTRYPSILSGDIGSAGNVADNSYHVVVGSGVNTTAVLEGFTITAGNANGASPGYYRGGGVYNVAGSPTIRSCIFSANSANYGGAMFNTSASSPGLTGCTFTANSAKYDGGGMVVYPKLPVM